MSELRKKYDEILSILKNNLKVVIFGNYQKESGDRLKRLRCDIRKLGFNSTIIVEDMKDDEAKLKGEFDEKRNLYFLHKSLDVLRNADCLIFVFDFQNPSGMELVEVFKSYEEKIGQAAFIFRVTDNRMKIEKKYAKWILDIAEIQESSIFRYNNDDDLLLGSKTFLEEVIRGLGIMQLALLQNRQKNWENINLKRLNKNCKKYETMT